MYGLRACCPAARSPSSTRCAFVLAGPLIALLMTPLDSAHAGTTCGTGWHVIPSPSTAERINELNGVAAVAVDDVWAVGSAGASALIEHWDGTSWSIARSPSIKGRLSDVDATSADDVWAVGSSRGDALIEHWDGRSWTVASRSIPGSLAGVSALRPRLALAVGTQRGPHERRPLALRFDGSSWEQVPTSNRGDPDPEALRPVVATSRDAAWAVGAADLGFDGITANLAER
jgi:hypothetical protein